jgi:site-specific recombinase XerD
VAAEYYPDHLLPLVGELKVVDVRFAEVRERVLLDYGRNTARAYWGDLDDVFWWAKQRDKDVLELTDRDVRQYVALLRRRKYSENTIRRRITVLRKLYDALIADGLADANPAKGIVVSRPRRQVSDQVT